MKKLFLLLAGVSFAFSVSAANLCNEGKCKDGKNAKKECSNEKKSCCSKKEKSAKSCSKEEMKSCHGEKAGEKADTKTKQADKK